MKNTNEVKVYSQTHKKLRKLRNTYVVNKDKINVDELAKKRRDNYKTNKNNYSKHFKKHYRVRKEKNIKEIVEKNHNRFKKLNYPTSKKDYKMKVKENLENIKEGKPLTVPLKILNVKLKRTFMSSD